VTKLLRFATDPGTRWAVHRGTGHDPDRDESFDAYYVIFQESKDAFMARLELRYFRSLALRITWSEGPFKTWRAARAAAQDHYDKAERQ
jgi:hypothetical protein